MHTASKGQRGRTSPPRLSSGEVLDDRFLVERWVGEGGMGAVYRAKDLETRLPAALKVMSSQRRSADDRFAREAQILAELSHPAIVRYLAHGTTASGTSYLAMEWLDGEDLSQRLAHRGLTVAQTLALVRRLCEGLMAAHAKSVVHRDIKPSNIFLVDGDAAASKLLDFGVAHLAAASEVLTRAGSVLGTIGYMAPEQATGLPELDARADVFAIGCVLYECLTGQAAFSAQHEVAVLAKVLRDDPPKISELRPGLGAGLDALVSRLLAKEREQRPADAAGVLLELDRLGSLTGDVPLTATRPRRGLIDSEQHIVTVILAQPVHRSAQTLPLDEAHEDSAQLGELCATFNAEQVPLQGGGLLLVLGATASITAADQAAQAARCALALRARKPQLALAVATGSVDASGRIPVGAAIERAAELLASQEGQQQVNVAIDRLTAGLLGGRFDVQRKSAGLALIGAFDSLEMPRVLMGRRSPLVGRDKELAFLNATLEECVSDEIARVVLLSGPPGLGKSRLGLEFVEQVRAKGSARVLIARAEPNSAGSSLRLLRRLIRSAAGLQESEALTDQQARLRDYLAFLPSSALDHGLEFLGELVGVPTDEPSALMRAARNDPEVMREQTRRAFDAWIDAESARRPLLLFVDDLHWGDPPSVVYLQDLVSTWTQRRILVLACARPEVHARFPRLWHGAGMHELSLKGLTPRAGERLVRAFLSSDQSAASERRIIELAAGNAFYLEELIRCAAEGLTDFPETVLAMVQSRIEALAPEERRVLRAASVFGETFWSGGVSALLETTLGGVWFDDLVERELLVRRMHPRFPGESEFAFRHAFVRDAAYAMLPAVDRAVAHRMAGDWLEQAGETDARVLADHFERGDTKDRAIPHVVQAALAAVDAGDIEGARALSQQGLKLGAAGAYRGILLVVDEYMSAWAGQPDRQRLCEALELLPRASSHWWLALATLIFCSQGNEGAAAAGPYVEMALASPPGTELTGFRSLALQSVASGTILMGRADVGWSLLDAFEEYRLDDPSCDQLFVARLMLARSHLGLYSPIQGKWQLQLALDWARTATCALDAAGSTMGEMTALIILGSAWLFLGAYGEAESAMRDSLEHARRKGNLLIEHYSQLLLAWVILRQQRVDEARALLGPVHESQDLNVVHGVHAVEAEASCLAGQYEPALRAALAATGGPALPYRRMAWTTVARARLALNDARGALDAVAAAAADGNAAPNLEFEIDLRTSQARAFMALGDREAASATLRAADAFLREVAGNITDADLRAGFLSNVRAHALLRELLATAM